MQPDAANIQGVEGKEKMTEEGIILSRHEALALINILARVEAMGMIEYKHSDFKEWIKVKDLKTKMQGLTK